MSGKKGFASPESVPGATENQISWWPISRPWAQLVAGRQEFIVGKGLACYPSS